MKIIVTGANSFLGAALCYSLINKGYEVFALINSTCALRKNTTKTRNITFINKESQKFARDEGGDDPRIFILG